MVDDSGVFRAVSGLMDIHLAAGTPRSVSDACRRAALAVLDSLRFADGTDPEVKRKADVWRSDIFVGRWKRVAGRAG